MSEEQQNTQNDTPQNESPQNEHPHNPTGEQSPVNQPGQTPLQAVKERKAAMQRSKEVEEQRPEPSPEVPGASNPSNRRKHPQRQLG